MAEATVLAPSKEPPKLMAGDVDLSAASYFEDPYRHYAHLRATQPVAPIHAMNAWLLTRHEDVKAAWLDDRLQIDFDQLQINRMGPEVVNEAFFKFCRQFMAFADPPDHSGLKQLFVQGFTRVRAQQYLPIMRAIVNETIDEFIDRGHGDLIEDYSKQVPLRVISAILGISKSDRELVRQWMDDFNPAIGFPPMTVEQTKLANAACLGMNDYFGRELEARARNPGNDLISELLSVNAKSEAPIDAFTIISNLILLYHAGQDTQKHHIGNTLVALHRHPDQLEFLKADPKRCWEHLDELLRYDSSGQITGRVAVEDMQIAGTAIMKGQTILLAFGAANRDPAVFPNPDQLDLQRAEARLHVTFGAGRHSCLGNGLARLSIPLMLEVLLARIPNLKVDVDGLEQNKTLSKRGFAKVPASWS